MTNNDKARGLIEDLKRGSTADVIFAAQQAARLIEKLTGEPSTQMLVDGATAIYHASATEPWAKARAGHAAMIEQGIKEVLDKQEKEQ